MTDDAHAWMIAIVLVAPPVAWWCWEMVRALRERIAARRIMRATWGDGAP
jgi:hypothetical protein